ncbi:MAG TPA: ParA family protein [Candidatus Saccharimonadia bacterium]|nr:ParA family protein [Candidatus Saccharimonadia bacterium]
MQKILVASSKGGCGKSTIATNLAAHFAQSGRNTAIVDLDRQQSSLRWAQRRPDNVAGVLGIEGKGKRWSASLPPDTERVIVDSPAGAHRDVLEPLLEDIDAMIVPVLPSGIDLDASTAYLKELEAIPRIKRGKVPVALVANRLKPWTNASQDAIAAMKDLPFPVVAQLRDSQGYVVLTGLGKSIFDYGSESVREHQADWSSLLRWLKKSA